MVKREGGWEEDGNVRIDIRKRDAVVAEVKERQSQGGGEEVFKGRMTAHALTNGTLATFQVIYEGTLTVDATGQWVFSDGEMQWWDCYDYDLHKGSSNRSSHGEFKTAVGRNVIPGQSFEVTSERVTMSQSSVQERIDWGAKAPEHVPDNLLGGAIDIATDATTGGVGLGIWGARAGVVADTAAPGVNVALPGTQTGADVGTAGGADVGDDTVQYQSRKKDD